MPATRTVLARGTLVYLRRPVQRDASPFLTAVKSSKRLHRLWVEPPSTHSRFASYLRRFSGPSSRDAGHATHVGVLVCRREDNAPVGVFNFSEIVRGAFQSAYLGYYGFAEHPAGEYTFDLSGVPRRLHPRGLFPPLRQDRRPLAGP